MFDLRYIEPLYGFGPDIDHIAVGDNAKARTTLSEMGQELPRTDRLIAIYIPEFTDEAYQPGLQSGRVVGAVRLLPMPLDRAITDYFYHDVDGSLRWPFGWPCEAIYAPPVEECVYLRTVVTWCSVRAVSHRMLNAFKPDHSGSNSGVAAELMRYFDRFQPIR